MNPTTHEQHLSTGDFAAVARGDARGDAQLTDQHTTKAAALFPRDVADGFRASWDHIQTGFVDEPRKAVQQADELVAQVINHLAESFSKERNRLEGQWDRGDQVNTEDLRVVLQTYRAFFQRLLSI
jgi:hypothetical protein